MIRHPSPARVATYLRQVAGQLDTNGDNAIARARSLAERGYPAATIGNGARSSDPTSSTERAALNPDGWADIDDTLARALRRLWADTTVVEGLLDRVLAHASDDDPTPAGQGPCGCGCGHVCRPTKKPDDRLRSGFAPACYRRWLRWRAQYPTATRSDYLHACAQERGVAS